MANAIFIGWGLAVRGREQKALQVFGEAVQYWAGVQQRGEIDSFEAYTLDPHGGDLAGFLIVRGSPEQLNRLRSSQEFNRLNARATFVLDNFGVVGASTGEEMEELFNEFGAISAELG